jgi:hypothetical protein
VSVHHVRILQDSNRLTYTVAVDGKQIEDIVTSMRLEVHKAGEPPTLTIDFISTADYIGTARVELEEQTKALLKQLGWTPPEEET